jgi:hypothetical protein
VHQRIVVTFERAAVKHVHGDDGMAPLAEIDERQRELGVEHGGERDDDGPDRHDLCDTKTFEKDATTS